GVTHCDGAAVDVQPVVRDSEAIPAIEHLYREGLIELPEPDVLHFDACALEQPRHGEYRSDSHFLRLTSGNGTAAEDPEWLNVAFLGELGVHDHAGAGAVGKLTRIAGGDYAIRQHRADLGHAFQGCIRTNAFIGADRDLFGAQTTGRLVNDAHSHLHRHDL